MPISYVSELVGTFMLTTTVSLCKVTAQKWATPWALGSMTVALVYALRPVTGGLFNPATCVGLGVLGKVKWIAVLGYCGVQVVSGIFAGFACSFVFGSSAAIAVGPMAGYSIFQAGLVEAIYTFMLSFVTMNTVWSERSKNNQYFGLAMGFVYVAGGYAGGGITGGFFNPAITLGIGLPSLLVGTGGVIDALVFVGCQVIGSVAAAGVFFLVRKEEHSGDFGEEVGALERASCEFLGAFMLIFTVGLNLATGSTAMPWSAAACLTSMMYSVGNISGGIFNPAIALAVVVSGRDKLSPANGALYCLMHIVAALVGGALLAWYFPNQIDLSRDVHHLLAGCFAEFLFTFVLVFVFLALATAELGYWAAKTDVFVGLAVGLCLTAGGFAIESIVLAGFNPAVTLGVTAANAWHGRADWTTGAALAASELVAGGAAFGFFRLTYRDEFK